MLIMCGQVLHPYKTKIKIMVLQGPASSFLKTILNWMLTLLIVAIMWNVSQVPGQPHRIPFHASLPADVCQAAQVTGSPHQLTSSRISQRYDMVGEVGESQIVVNIPVTSVPGWVGSNAKTFGLQHLQFLDMGTSGGPSNGTRIVHHGTDELLIQQNTIPDGKTASIQEGAQRCQPLRHSLSHLIDIYRSGLLVPLT